MKIQLSIETDDGKKYTNGFIVDDMPDRDFVGKSTLCKSLYLLLLAMSRTMFTKLKIPFFVDLKREMGGEILGAKFIIDNARMLKLDNSENE